MSNNPDPTQPHDQNPPTHSFDPALDAGLAAAFGPEPTPGGWSQPPLLRDDTPDYAPLVRPSSPEMPRGTDDRYQLLGEIARGGMGVVLKGRDPDLGRDLAFKVLRQELAGKPAAVQRFVEEAQVGGQLQHPGIVPVYDLGRFADGRPYFAMKLVKGRTLADLLTARPDPATDRGRFVRHFLQVCQTVAYAHSRGVIHRDLKPANVMVGAFDEVLVMDWGLAKVLPRGGIADEIKASQASRQHPEEEPTEIKTARFGSGSDTAAGSVMGTPAFMSPEQAGGEIDKLDERADVFGLGAILCVILTGKPPYVADTGDAIRLMAVRGQVADAFARLDACGADAELIALCKRCLAADRDARPRHAGEVAGAVSGHLAGVEARAHQAELDRAAAEARALEEVNTRRVAEEKAAEERKRRKVQLALAAALGLLMLAGGAFAWWQNEQTQLVRQRDARNAEAVTVLLDQCETALRAGDAAKASVGLEAARKRSAEGGAEQQSQRLGLLDADLTLLHDLGAIDQFRWDWPDSQFPDPAVVATRTREALRQFGFDPDAVSPDEAAARVSASVLRERIVLALDRLLQNQKTAGVRAILGRLDPDPYRDTVRNAVLAGDGPKLDELASRQAAMEQPPEFTVFLGESWAINVVRRRQLLEATVSRRSGDLSLLMTLGMTYSIGNTKDRKDKANDQLRWFQAAVAAAPANRVAYNSLGCILCDVKRDYDGAIVYFRKAIEHDPKSANDHCNMGNALKGKGRWDEAIAYYRKAIELNPTLARAHTGLGSVLSRDDQVDEAIACHRKALELDPKSVTAFSNLGSILCDVKRDYDGAIVYFRKAIELDPTRAKVHSNLGTALSHKGLVDEAIACYRKATELDPTLAATHQFLALVYARESRLDEAIACWRKAIELDPQDATFHNDLGVTLKQKGQVDEAIACYRKAIELNPKDAVAHSNLGFILRDAKGDYDGAIACYRKIIELNPKNANAHNDLGLALSGKGQWDEATTCYHKVIELDPKNASAHDNLGVALQGKGQLDEAIACWRKAIDLDPKFAHAHTNLGLAMKDKRQWDEAIACFRKAIDLDPKSVTAHSNLGTVLSNAKRDYEGAIACYRRVIELDPKDANAHNNLGTILCDVKRDFAGAIASFRKVIELDPKYAKAHYNLGNALGKTGKLDESIACYRKAVELDPKLAPAHYNLGLMLSIKRDYDGAIPSFREAVKLDPKHAAAHKYLGAALEGKGQVNEAIVCYRKLVELDPKSVAAHYDLGKALGKTGQLDEAIACFRKIIELDPKDANAHNVLGLMLGVKRDYSGAIACFREAIKLDPKNAAPHNHLGEVLQLKGDWEGAIAAYKEAVKLDPKNAVAHNSLGEALANKRDLDGAIPAYREAIRLNPTYARAHNNLGWVLQQKGDLDEAIAEYKEALKHDPKNPHAPSNLRQAERMRDLLSRQLDVLAGKAEPKSPAEACEFAMLCSQPFQKRYTDAVRLFEKAFAADPKLANDLSTYHRYNAACHAALAAGLNPAERAVLQGKALAWLRADLTLHRKLAASSSAAERKTAADKLSWWLRDSDFAGVRPGLLRIGMKADERVEWDAFWAEVKATITTAHKPPRSELAPLPREASLR